VWNFLEAPLPYFKHQMGIHPTFVEFKRINALFSPQFYSDLSLLNLLIYHLILLLQLPGFSKALRKTISVSFDWRRGGGPYVREDASSHHL
jgi:hypothetical protein